MRSKVIGISSKVVTRNFLFFFRKMEAKGFIHVTEIEGVQTITVLLHFDAINPI
jgi:hypothetical protein